ncbi:VOC family protein [Ramlibacter sp. USB13]|uniref:VOC family protein n=1 Tax=Ramlibacter cellulosilyticus TaxID=2764187 RepID=A0A923MS63_9BURK|nr:VOC family protein [Ramlibacter cellulosilyticus]MBC5783614.1 VOC family protein [Ramlibacter cellulosilyticus]
MDPVVHFELPYDDRERIARFYQSAFGWKLEMLGQEMGNYVLATTAEQDLMPQGKANRGAINGGFFQRSPEMPGQHPSVVVGVQDIRAAMRRVKEAGGEVLGEPMEIPGVGPYVAFYDTERNRLSMLQPLMPS